MKMRHLVPFVCLISFAITRYGNAAQHGVAPEESDPAANIILLIGDGMGHSVIGLARDYARIVEDRELWTQRAISQGRLALMHGLADGALVADSAAAGTAIATGKQTNNRAVSMTPQGVPLTTILELAQRDSRNTGLVTTTRLTHATPACFAAHTEDRDLENEIAEQLVASGVDVMMGGGLRNWIPEDTAASDFARFSAIASIGGESMRKDKMNLLETASEAAYELVTNRSELLAIGTPGKVLGLFAASHLPYALDRRPDDAADVPSLAEMTDAALRVLSKNERGLFLMVEGGRIDHAAHNNDLAAMVAEMIDFDDAVGVAYAFAKKHPNTIVFITADHATGAPSLSPRYSEEIGETVYPGDAILRKVSRQDASFEYIVYSWSLEPSMTAMKNLVLEHTGVEISDEDAMLIVKAGPLSPFHVIKPKYRKLGYPMLALGRVLGIEYSTAWATAEHYAAPVPLIGYGLHAERVHGYLDNTDMFHIMKTVGGL